MTIELVPSILSANFARLADDAKAALEGGGTEAGPSSMLTSWMDTSSPT